MATIYFLEASVPLVKGYTLNAQNEIKSTPYPHVSNFKSHKASCPTLKEFYTQLTAHAAQGHCLLKGRLNRDLDFTSRAGSTNSNDTTDWVCLDLDGAPFATPEAFMSEYPLFDELSYIVQYSASQGLGKPGLRCHIFIMLSGQYNVSYLKSWLMSLNLDGTLWAGAVRKSITLSPAKAALHWPIDITVCQNDKLIYIAPAQVAKGVPYKAPTPAIQLVAKKRIALDTSVFGTQSIEVQKKEQRALLNALRKEAGLEVVRPTRTVGEYDVQGKPGEAIITERWVDEDAGFMRFNLNGGNSNAYYHPLNNYELIHNFKGEPSYLTKELLPQYYKDCKAREKHEAVQPTEQGEVILGVCDKRSAALWKISWNKQARILQRYPARSDKQLLDWYMQHGKTPGEFTPQWTLEFNPQSDTVLDLDKQYLNTYVQSPFYKNYTAPARPTPLDACPIIKRVCMSVVSNNRWNEVTEHLMNWLAVLIQHRIKIGTSWLLTGTEGSGKNLLVINIIGQLLSPEYVKATTVTALEDGFNGWLEHTLLCLVNEIQISASASHKTLASKLRNWITDSPLDMRNMNTISYNAPNYTNFFFASNKPDPIEINNEDRRYNVGEYQDTRLVISQKEIDVGIPKELPAFFSYLMTRKADITVAHTLIQTQTRRDVINAGRNSIDMLAEAIMDGDLSPFVDALPDMRLIMEISGADSAKAVAYDTIVRRELQGLLNAKVPKGGVSKSYNSTLNRDELFIIFDYCVGNMSISPWKFTNMLSHKKLDLTRIRDNGGKSCRGIKVTWTAGQAWCDEHMPEAQPLRRVK